QDLRVWNRIVKDEKRKLRRLELRPAVEVRNPVTTVSAWVTVRLLFSHYISPTSNKPPLSLRSLTLRGLDFGGSIATLIRAVNFANLEHLEVTSMRNNRTFLVQLLPVLQENEEFLRLERLHLSTIDDTDANALDDFLRACTSLTELTIKAKGPADWMVPNRASKTRHRETLRVFAWSVYEGEGMNGWEVHEAHPNMKTTIVPTLRELEELSLHLGTSTIGNSRAAGTRAVRTLIDRISRRCPNLRALRFLRWPVYPPQADANITQPPAGGPHDDASVALLRHEVWEYTRRLVWNFLLYRSLVTRPANARDLRVLMIGTTSWDCLVDVAPPGHVYVLDDIPSLTYVRREQVDFDGVRSMVAVKADSSAIEYDDRRYAMFDYGK
ncbi:hypothetical protein LTR95_018966, partial [Oleoguttula sp. CCFEE 5521]